MLNDTFEVQQINEAAMDIMHIRSASDVLGEHVVRIMDPKVFYEVQKTRFNVHNRRVYLAEYKRYVELTVVYDTDNHLYIGIMRDITDEEKREKRKRVSPSKPSKPQTKS